MKLKIRTEKVIDSSDWDQLIRETYGRPYCFQQQDGCQGRGTHSFTVPEEADDFENESVPEIVNHGKMGVSFAKWLERDPKQPLSDEDKGTRTEQWAIVMWWNRNFYPDIQMVANDLHSRGLVDAGDYVINIDW